MTVASAPHDYSFYVQTAIGQHAEIYSSAPAETLSEKVYVMLESCCAATKFWPFLKIGRPFRPFKHAGVSSGGSTRTTHHYPDYSLTL